MAKILAVGLNLMDCYQEQGLMYPGGNELNVAVYARRLGCESGFLGVFGSDPVAELIRQVLDQEGVDYSRSRNAHGESGQAWVCIVDGDRVFTGHNNGGVTGSQPLRFDREDFAYAAGFDVLCSSLYGRVPPEELLKLSRCGVPLAFDFSNAWPQPLLEQLAPQLSYAFFSCAEKSLDEIKALLRHVRELGCPYCVATRGERGSLLFDGEHYMLQPAVPVDIVDTMGAGDSFIAAFLLSHYDSVKSGADAGTALKAALASGAEFAAETCRQSGAIGYEFPLDTGSYILEERS